MLGAHQAAGCHSACGARADAPAAAATPCRHQRGSLERLLHVAAFAVSGYASGACRHCKPFTPLLGETFEYMCPERKFRFLGEKVGAIVLGLPGACSCPSMQVPHAA